MIPIIRLPAEPKPIQFDPYIEDFRIFAIQMHGDQLYAGMSYAFHLASVEAILSAHGFVSYTDRAVAWLHDVVEDTSCTVNDIAKYYSPEIAIHVDACTGVGSNRKERNQSIYDKIKESPKSAKYKVADRIANMKQGILTENPKLEMYVREFRDFSDNIKPLMIEDRETAIIWTTLEQTVSDAIRTCNTMRKMKLAA